MAYAARMRALYPFREASTSVDNLVIGGGVVGLAVAAGLVNTAGRDRTTFLVERRKQLGQETTARNSEVIHSGIYYPVGSLKSRLCIRGRDLIYQRCAALDIGHRKTQKLIVATSNSQISYLDHLQTLSLDPRLRTGTGELSVTQNDSSVPVYFLSGDEARDMEPDLSPSIKGALIVTETGIVDSQGLVDSLEREIEDEDYIPQTESSVAVGIDGKIGSGTRGEGVIVKGTRVVRIDKDDKGGWIVQLESNSPGIEGEKGDIEAVRTEVLVNAAGLSATSLMEGVVSENERVKTYAVKGNYMSYKGPGVENVSRLIYPCPNSDISALGTHLTMDLDGNIRFGPDVEPLGPPSLSSDNPDFWQEHLAPSASRLESIGRIVQDYLPNIDPTLLQPDYAGIRPNIAPPGSGFSDFMIRHVEERRGLVELLGFNSPGLTSSLAVGEYVARMINREIRSFADLSAWQ